MRQTTALSGGILSGAAERLLNIPSTLFDGLRTAAERRRTYLRTCRELENCTDRQLDDMGIARCDIRRIARDAADAA